MIKPSEIHKLRLQQKEANKKKKKGEDSIPSIDTTILDYYRGLKETLKEADGKVSVLVRLYEEEYAQKVRHELAFQNTFMLDKYLP